MGRDREGRVVGGEFTYIQVCSSVKPILIHHTERGRKEGETQREGGQGRRRRRRVVV